MLTLALDVYTLLRLVRFITVSAIRLFIQLMNELSLSGNSQPNICKERTTPRSTDLQTYVHNPTSRLVRIMTMPFPALPLQEYSRQETRTHDQGSHNTRALRDADGFEHRGEPAHN